MLASADIESHAAIKEYINPVFEQILLDGCTSPPPIISPEYDIDPHVNHRLPDQPELISFDGEVHRKAEPWRRSCVVPLYR